MQKLVYYKKLLREASHIKHSSFREYAKRKIQYDFRTKKYVQEESMDDQLQTIKRIAKLTELYCNKLI